MGIFKKLAKNFKKLLKNKKTTPAKKAKKKVTKAKTKSKANKAGKVKARPKAKSKKSAKRSAAKKVAVKKQPSIPKNYVKLGIVTHYFPHVEAGVIKIQKGTITVGDEVHIKGATTDFKQRIESLQIDRVPVQSAKVGAEVGFGAKDRVRQHDTVYLVKSV